jgi:hypothetical protein
MVLRLSAEVQYLGVSMVFPQTRSGSFHRRPRSFLDRSIQGFLGIQADRSSSRAWFSIFIIRSPIQRMTGTAMGTGYSGLVGVGLGTLPPHARGVNLRILFVESYKPHESSP